MNSPLSVDTEAPDIMPASKPRPFRSIGRKFSIALIGTITAILVIFAAIALLVNRERSEAQLDNAMATYLNVTEVALQVPVWNVDYTAVQGVTDALLRDDQVHYVEVMEGESQIAVSVREDMEGIVFASFAESDDYMTGVIDVAYQGEVIAQLRLAMSRQAVVDAIRINAFGILGLTLLIVGAIAIVSVYATRRYVAGPMARLQKSASAIASGDLEREIPSGRNDEIGRLATDFNSMREAVKGLFSDLNTANSTLERRVDQRTHELSRKNRELETLSGKLSKYLSPQVYASIFAGRQEVKLQSQRKKLTVFFSDIAGFTDTTDRLESEELTMMLNRYLSAMSEVALAHGATIDKYMGDGIMIFFGDPESRGVKEDALACVRMAVDMQARMEGLAEDLRTLGVAQPQRCRMGINTGFCTVGNFGSDDRMDYTIIGGAVNIAARLEQEAEAGGVLISYETYAHVKDHFRTEQVGELHVKGIAHPILTYRVLGAVEDGTRELSDMFNLHLDLAAMTSDQRAEAEDTLRQALARLGEVKRD